MEILKAFAVVVLAIVFAWGGCEILHLLEAEIEQSVIWDILCVAWILVCAYVAYLAIFEGWRPRGGRTA